MALGGGQTKPHNSTWDVVVSYLYLFLWIGLSTAVILINKYVLAYTGFTYPVALTMVHMAFCASLATVLLKLGVSEAQPMTREDYIRNVLPIAALFAGTLWCGNAAYLYLSVAFIQMLKAIMPIAVFVVGIMLGTEKYGHLYALNMVLVTLGVAIASYGEINFNILGVIFQGGSIVTESFRLVLIQILLQQRGVKLNPITTLYYIAPPCFVFLCVPFGVLEYPRMVHDEHLKFNPGILLASAAAAFALNMSVFMLIGKTSALTMNIGGVVKDWLLIGLSVLLFGSPVSRIQLFGYGLSFLGVAWYNHTKLQALKEQAAEKQAQEPLIAQVGGADTASSSKSNGP